MLKEIVVDKITTFPWFDKGLPQSTGRISITLQEQGFCENWILSIGFTFSEINVILQYKGVTFES